MKKTKLVIAILLSLTATSWAADNSIYIDQSGDYSTISVTQDGSGNQVNGILTNGSVGGPTDPAKMVGNNQQITIKQTGPANTLALGVNTTVGTNGKGITINYDVSEGSGYNTAYINSNNNGLGTSAGNLIDVTQSGGYGNLRVSMLGNTNNFVAVTSGGSQNKIDATINANSTQVNISQTGGGGNETTLNLTGNKGGVDITTVGATNITSITQSGGSVNGNYAKLDYTGSGNNTTINQSGLFDNNADIKIVSGSSNTLTVTQSGGASAGQYAKVELTGSNNSLGITQQGSVDNLTNLKISGGHNTYTVIQK